MRAVTLIFLILVIMIAFGFVLSESIQSGQEALVLAQRVEELQTQLAQLEADLGACKNQTTVDATTIQGLQNTIGGMTAEKQRLEDEIARLNTQIALLKSKQDLLDIFNENPVILAGALLTQLAAAAMKFNKKLGLQWLTKSNPASDEEYVKLSREEVRRVIASRRNNSRK